MLLITLITLAFYMCKISLGLKIFWKPAHGLYIIAPTPYIPLVNLVSRHKNLYRSAGFSVVRLISFFKISFTLSLTMAILSV